MKKMQRIMAVILAVMLTLSLAACGGGGEKTKGKTKVSFWVEVSAQGLDTWMKLVEDFNNSHPHITVTLVPQSAGYASGLSNTLRGSNPPDVIVVDDKLVKSYVSEGYLEKLDSYIAADTNPNFSLADMWESGVERFSYNPETGYSGIGSDYYAIPNGINPALMYYNVDLFEHQSINIISIPENELTGNLLPHGYYVYNVAPMDGMMARADGKYHVFNNRIPMNWEELIALSKIFTKAYNSASGSTYGFMSEWWFAHGWSIGADCLEWDEAKQQYIFALGDSNPNYLVTGSAGVTINGTSYNEGDLLSYADKNYVAANQSDSTIAGYLSAQNLYPLPSNKAMFTEFAMLSQSTGALVTEGVYGYGISPTPNALDATSMSGYFTTGEVAMLSMEGRLGYDIGETMNLLGKKWDVAPLYQYREYNEDGSVKTVNGTNAFGKQATHSYDYGFAIPANAKNKQAAWEFVSYMAGLDGQKELMKRNNAIPNQKSLAYSDEYLNLTENFVPANRIAAVEMAEFASVGDWAYVENGEWINGWSNVLNTKVRNGEMTLDQFFENADVIATNEILKKYTARKYNG